MPNNTYKQRTNKYNARKTLGRTSDGGHRTYDSKLEAAVADELYLRMRGGEIKDYECQFKVVMTAYTKDGDVAMTMNHKVDFRVHENDDSYTLLEAKGLETSDWKMRRNWLTMLWLPENLDHTYEVVKNSRQYRHIR